MSTVHFLLAFVFFPILAAAQTVTDEGAMAALLRPAATECAAKAGQGDVAVLVKPAAPSLVLQAFSERLLQAGARVWTDAASASTVMDVELREMNSSTALSANSSYLRHSFVRMGVLVRNKTSGAVVWSKEYALSQDDTLRERPATMERDFLRLETESWSEKFAAPVLASVTALVIVILLFTIRGS